MKKRFIFASVLLMPLALLAPQAHAADQEPTPKTAPPATVDQTPAMSEIPVMKEQGKRMALLVEQLSKESSPEIRRRIMAEVMCPQ